MADDIEIPKVGKLPKKVLIPLAVGLAGFVAWRFWVARSDAAAADQSTVEDGDFGAVDTAVPDTLNPFPSSFSSPAGSTSTTGGGDRNGDGLIGPGEFTTNGEWTDYVVSKLTQSDQWTYTDIITALGNGLAGKPTTDLQQAILRAALAVGGQPPVGNITIVSGGNTPILVAPTGLAVQSVTTSAVTVKFNMVSGAAKYLVYRSGGGPVSGTGSPITVGLLQPNTSYTMSISAVTAAGVEGPRSADITAKTAAAPVTTTPKPTTKPPVYATVTVVKYTTKNPPWNSTLSGIAAHYKKTWQSVWNDPKNAGLRSRRKDPKNIRPGDKVYVRTN